MVLVVLRLVCGLTLFIYGMQIVKTGLKRQANRQQKTILKCFTGTKLSSILTGALATVLMQSSSATIVLIISFVNVELINLSQALGMVIGSNIGTTVTGQIFSFNLESYFWVFFLLGLLFFVLHQSRLFKRWFYLAIAKIFVGFGLIFLGLNLLASISNSLGGRKLLLKFIPVLSQNHFLAFLSGVLGTVFLQSSSAFIGVVLILAKQSLIQLPTAILLLLGSNIGTCVTALLAAINGSLTAKRVAWGHVIFNLGGALVFLPFVIPFSSLVALTSNQLTRQVANSHTLFNIVNAFLFYLVFDYFVKIVEKL